ncbi:hypothetical protein UPYG_G00234960 [Umbra pygmaea]|uniref:Uncharacterized protein n=1 Tax=Umbra pygmaea TaxID=75934 RepID=A0ABD0WE43_UMBPY
MGSSTSELSEDQFHCSICQDVFTEPVSIPCGHNFCKTCISEKWDSTDQYQCPLCQEIFHRRPKLHVNKEFRDDKCDSKYLVPAPVPVKAPVRHGVADSIFTCKNVMALVTCLLCVIYMIYLQIWTNWYAVDVTLDPNTAHPNLILSQDGKQVRFGNIKQNLPDNSKRFDSVICVLGKEGFSSGRFYYEVHVKGKTRWELGLARESINRKGQITLNPGNGFWTMWLRDGEYMALAGPDVHLSLTQKLHTVGVFVDYEWGQVSFYNVEAGFLIYSFTGQNFTEKLYPFFSPGLSDDGKNLAPMIIPYSETVFKQIQQYAEDVTLDPDTAHSQLIISEHGKRVRHNNTKQNVPDNPKRFDSVFCVLGKEGFSSGRFYYEVQVKGKTIWDLGVARESVNRKGIITLNPADGYWSVVLRDGEYKAAADPPVLLYLSQKPQKVGVFVDYEKGQVSFYDVEARSLIYSFTNQNFIDKLHPYFGPSLNDGGKNSAPLVITPVRR